jgi:hypothetical protein
MPDATPPLLLVAKFPLEVHAAIAAAMSPGQPSITTRPWWKHVLSHQQPLMGSERLPLGGVMIANARTSGLNGAGVPADDMKIVNAETDWDRALAAEKKGLILIVVADEQANRHGNELLALARRLYNQALDQLNQLDQLDGLLRSRDV